MEAASAPKTIRLWAAPAPSPGAASCSARSHGRLSLRIGNSVVLLRWQAGTRATSPCHIQVPGLAAIGWKTWELSFRDTRTPIRSEEALSTPLRPHEHAVGLGSHAHTPPRARSVWHEAPWKMPWPTQSSASSSANRSAISRRSDSRPPPWPRRSKRRSAAQAR
jgi:hypothetical protein